MPPLVSETRFAAIDFESAGAARGRTDEAVQVGLAEWSLGSGAERPFVSFLRAEGEITWAAGRVHGITRDDLKDAPPLVALWPRLKAALGGAAVVAHGHGTEKRFLRAFPGHGFGPWVDTLGLARAAWPGLKSHALGDVCAELGVGGFGGLAPGRSWHDALFDALASLALLERVVRDFALADAPLEFLLRPDLSEWRRLR